MPAHDVGHLDARAEPTWPAQAFSSMSMTCAGQRYCDGPFAVRLDSTPNVDGVAGRIKEDELLPSRDDLRPENRERKDTPLVAGVARDGANVGVGAFRRRGDRWFRERPVLTRAVHGVWIGSPTRLRPAVDGRQICTRRQRGVGGPPRGQSRLPGWGAPSTA